MVINLARGILKLPHFYWRFDAFLGLPRVSCPGMEGPDNGKEIVLCDFISDLMGFQCVSDWLPQEAFDWGWMTESMWLPSSSVWRLTSCGQVQFYHLWPYRALSPASMEFDGRTSKCQWPSYTVVMFRYNYISSLCVVCGHAQWASHTYPFTCLAFHGFSGSYLCLPVSIGAPSGVLAPYVKPLLRFCPSLV